MRGILWPIVLLFSLRAVCGQEPEEGPPVFFADSLLSEEVLQGAHYKVAPVVRVERFRYHFVLSCEFGSVDVWGIDGVKEGVAELEAISKLSEIRQTESFARSFSDALKTPVAKAWSVASRPVSTVKGIPMGLNRYLQGKFYQVKRQSRKAVDYVKKRKKKGETTKEKEEKKAVSKKLKQGTGKLSRKHLGFNRAKRRWAQRFGVDPYSKNELLQDALGRIAWASSLGSFSADFVIPASDALSYAGRAEGIVWSKSPTELERLNHIALKKMGFSPEEILEFHDNRQYSLTEKVELVLALKALGDIEGRLSLLQLTMGAQDDHDTVFISSIFDLLASYHEDVSPLQRIEIRGGLAIGINTAGTLIYYLHWSPDIAEAVMADDLEMEKRELWVTGKVSPISAYRLRKLGWEVEERCDNVFREGIAD